MVAIPSVGSPTLAEALWTCRSSGSSPSAASSGGTSSALATTPIPALCRNLLNIGRSPLSCRGLESQSAARGRLTRGLKEPSVAGRAQSPARFRRDLLAESEHPDHAALRHLEVGAEQFIEQALLERRVDAP